VPTLPAEFFRARTPAPTFTFRRTENFFTAQIADTTALFLIKLTKKPGRLEYIEHVSTGGKTPRNFAIDPTGRFLLAANQNSDSIVVFRIDEKSGKLTATGNIGAAVPTPVCLKLIPAFSLETQWIYEAENSSNLDCVFLSLRLLCNPAIAGNRVTGKLTFKDEFNKAANTPVDSAKWTAEIGGAAGATRNCSITRTTSENAYHDGAGSLVIKAIKKDLPLSFKCWYGQCKYTSARLITKGKFDQKYGRFEARIKIPRGQGMWSAFWMLGNNIDAVGWAACGEIDVMENIGREPSIVHGTIHGPGYSGANAIGAPFNLANNKKFADDFHVYATEWTENKIAFYVDGKLYKTITRRICRRASSGFTTIRFL
jgi:hypothetical protein